jgi:transcriptional regulator with PAS, ATPase and Fis domain
VLRLFQRYGWPGNIRELKQVLECAMMFGEGPLVRPEDLPEYMKADPAPRQALPSRRETLYEALDAFERDYIQARIPDARSLSELAGRLRISRQTLKYKMQKHGLNLLVQDPGASL